MGSNLYRLGISDKVIQAILRHANVSVTLSYYVKSTSADVAAAMEKLEAKIAEDSRDTNGTPKADPGASRGFVN